MKLAEIVEKLGLQNLTPEIPSDVEVSRGYASDLLSDVLANAPKGGVLVTIQVHMNVIAVSCHAGLSAVIFTLGRTPEEPVRRRAVEERIALFTTKETTFDIVGQLYGFGLRGRSA